jgi:uncharacterized membrane protein (TIGR02234 family)
VTANQRRELLTVLAVAVLAAGAVLLASSQRWLSLHAIRPAPFAPVTVSISGRTEFPALFGLAIVAVITVVLVSASGGWGRRVLGLLLLVMGMSAAWYGAKGFSAPGSTRAAELLGGRAPGTGGVIEAQTHALWPLSTVGSGLLLAATGIVISVRGSRWSGGLSSKYDAPARASRLEDPWRRMDRGDDPTITDR